MDIFKNNIDFNTYKTFYAVAVFESFSKAAEELYISQPAVSYSVKKLEEELGTKLFVRYNKSIKLTEDGEKLKFYIESAFNNIVEGHRALKENNYHLKGEISIGVHSNIGTFLLPKYIKEFLILYPDVKFIVHSTKSNDLKAMMQDGKLDILILSYPIFEDNQNFNETKILSLENCFFTTKKYYDTYLWAKKENMMLEFPLLLPIKGFNYHSFEKKFKKNNIVLSSNLYLYTTEMIISLVKEGLGIGWALKECVKPELDNCTLYELPLDIEMPKTDFSIAYDEKHINKTALTFANFLIKELEKDKQNCS